MYEPADVWEGIITVYSYHNYHFTRNVLKLIINIWLCFASCQVHNPPHPHPITYPHPISHTHIHTHMSPDVSKCTNTD